MAESESASLSIRNFSTNAKSATWDLGYGEVPQLSTCANHIKQLRKPPVVYPLNVRIHYARLHAKRY